MIYIDFDCNKSNIAQWRQWCKDNDIDDADEPECRTGYLERGSGVMDYYFRLLCIAAYLRINESSQVSCSAHLTVSVRPVDTCLKIFYAAGQIRKLH